MKTCSKCGGSGPFPATGNQCKQCLAALKARWYQKNKARVTAKSRRYKRHTERWREKHRQDGREKYVKQEGKRPGGKTPSPYSRFLEDVEMKGKRGTSGVLCIEQFPEHTPHRGETPLIYDPETDVYEGKAAGGKSTSISPVRYRRECLAVARHVPDELLSRWLYAISFPDYWTASNVAVRNLLQEAVKSGKRIIVSKGEQ